MPTAEMYEEEAKRLAAERDAERAAVKDAVASLNKYIRENGELQAALRAAERSLAFIAASRARRDKRRAGKLAAARIRFLCPGISVPIKPEQKGGAL